MGTDGGMAAFLRWFHEDVMRFDTMEYRRRFWREAYRRGHTIGDTPRTVIEFTDPRRHPYGEWAANLALLAVAMGASAVIWWLVRAVDAHVRRLRRPTYYEAERGRRAELAAERRRIRRRTTTSPCPTPEALREAFARARASTASMIRFGSMLEDLECYVDNSVVWSEGRGRIVGRCGGIRQWLRENAPDLSERYKTVMKYKALAKRFRQAVGVSDPVPASAVLPPEPPEGDGTGEGKGREVLREYSSERSRGGNCGSDARSGGRSGEVGYRRWGGGVDHGRTPEEVVESRVRTPEEGMGRSAQTPEAIAKALLERCEGTVASLAAQLALMVSEDFVPCENIARNEMLVGGRRARAGTGGRMVSTDDKGTGSGKKGVVTGGRGIDAGQGRSSAVQHVRNSNTPSSMLSSA